MTAVAPAPDQDTAAPGLAIRARGLTKRFGSIVALDGLDLDVPAGSIFGLLGPNGAGASTVAPVTHPPARR